VLVWLGEEEYANIALDHLKRLENDTSNSECLYKAPQEAWDACDALFYRPAWWTRTWILQEVIHERPVLVYMGHLTIELEDLCAKFNAYSKGSTSRVLGQRQLGTGKTVSERYSWLFKSTRMNSDSANVIQLSRQKIKMGGSFNLLYLIYVSRAQKATDPKDKIFALLGMLDGASPITPDYASSKRAVYISATREVFHKSLFILLMVESPRRRVYLSDDLPSWVPEFSTPQHPIANFVALRSSFFRASPEGPEVQFSSHPSREILILKGVYVAVVTDVYIAEFKNADQAREDETLELKLINYNDYPAARWKSTKVDLLPSPCGERKRAPTPENTSWGPYWVEVEDIIIVAKGSSLPLVLRRTSDYYLLVGACFLIDSQILQIELDQNLSFTADDPGFSSIMRGSVWDEVGKSRQEEHFHIH
jgi:hypothetical protein